MGSAPEMSVAKARGKPSMRLTNFTSVDPRNLSPKTRAAPRSQFKVGDTVYSNEKWMWGLEGKIIALPEWGGIHYTVEFNNEIVLNGKTFYIKCLIGAKGTTRLLKGEFFTVRRHYPVPTERRNLNQEPYSKEYLERRSPV